MGTSKRKAPEIKLPKVGDDPEERKRVLNVLAQRRYRQRKREHVKKLEAAATGPLDATQHNVALPSSNEQRPTPLAGDRETSREIDAAAFHTFDKAYPPDFFQQAAIASDDVLTTSHLMQSPVNYAADLQQDDVGDPWALPSLPASPSPISTHSSSLTSFSSPSASSSSQHNPSSDSYCLPILELQLLRGAFSIATRLNISSSILWSPDSFSPYGPIAVTDPTILPDFSTLPPNLRPTALQLTIPHHPVIDILPWPTVRDKLLIIFSAPPEQRPTVAAGPAAIAELAYDIEDSTEGVRIWGDDPYSDQNWEVGAKVWERWWWALDRDVVARSNELRRMRGAKLLGSGGGRVVGEVG